MSTSSSHYFAFLALILFFSIYPPTQPHYLVQTLSSNPHSSPHFIPILLLVSPPPSAPFQSLTKQHFHLFSPVLHPWSPFCYWISCPTSPTNSHLCRFQLPAHTMPSWPPCFCCILHTRSPYKLPHHPSCQLPPVHSLWTFISLFQPTLLPYLLSSQNGHYLIVSVNHTLLPLPLAPHNFPTHSIFPFQLPQSCSSNCWTPSSTSTVCSCSSEYAISTLSAYMSSTTLLQLNP